MKARFRNTQLKYKYGISLDEYENMLKKQENSCAICGSRDPRGQGVFHVDHCHLSHKVRGLLCQPCNMMLGLIGDNTSTLASAMAYLALHNEGSPVKDDTE